MTITQRLEVVIGELENIQGEFRAITTGDDEDWKRAYVDLRRRMQALFDRMSVLAEDIRHDDGKAEYSAGYREALSRLRHQAALHQSSWPVVLIDPSDPDYNRSVLTVRDAGLEFVTMARSVLAALRAR